MTPESALKMTESEFTKMLKALAKEDFLKFRSEFREFCRTQSYTNQTNLKHSEEIVNPLSRSRQISAKLYVLRKEYLSRTNEEYTKKIQNIIK